MTCSISPQRNVYIGGVANGKNGTQIYVPASSIVEIASSKINPKKLSLTMLR